LVPKRKANAKMRKKKTNFILGIFILSELYHILLSINIGIFKTVCKKACPMEGCPVVSGCAQLSYIPSPGTFLVAGYIFLLPEK
jgi:hypothetical protein